jgi:hypothetical protein
VPLRRWEDLRALQALDVFATRYFSHPNAGGRLPHYRRCSMASGNPHTANRDLLFRPSTFNVTVNLR